MSTIGIVLLVIVFFACGIIAMIFDDEVDKLPHYCSEMYEIMDLFYYSVIFLCGFIIVGNKLIKFFKKKFYNTEILEKNYEDEIEISMSNTRKLIACTIIGLLAMFVLFFVIFIIINSISV